jgi:hypothetical protein
MAKCYIGGCVHQIVVQLHRAVLNVMSFRRRIEAISDGASFNYWRKRFAKTGAFRGK